MDESGIDEPYGYRDIDAALERYYERATDPNEPPLVLAFIRDLLFNPSTHGDPLPDDPDNPEVHGMEKAVQFVPDTGVVIIWALDHPKRDVIVVEIGALADVLG